MTKLDSRVTRLGAVVQYEDHLHHGHCRDVVVANEASIKSYVIGTVLGKYFASPAGVAAAAGGNTGNGAMGAITVTSNANLQIGTYTLTIVKAAANAGDFIVRDPAGDVVGYGTVAVAFSMGGLAFTLADGATDFVVGDSFTIAVTGDVKYKIIEATATDGSQNFAGIYIGSSAGDDSQSIAATTDTNVVIINRGQACVGKGWLVFGSSVNTDAEKAAIYAQMEAVGIKVLDQPESFA